MAGSPDRGAMTGSPGQRLRLAWRRSDRLRGYALLAPTLLVMLALLGLPLVALLVVSFWRQEYVSLDTSFTANADIYQDAPTPASP